MFDITKHIKLIGTTLLLLMAWSCSDDDKSSPEISIIPEDQQPVKVRLRIPTIGPSFYATTTRAGDDEVQGTDAEDTSDADYLGNGEASISNLYLVAIQATYENEYVEKKSVEGEIQEEKKTDYYFMEADRVVVTPLNPFNDKGIIGQDDSYELQLYPGRYRFYLFANTDLYVDNSIYTSDNHFTEEMVKQIYLKYEASTPLRKAHLPMVCLPESFLYGTSRTNAQPASGTPLTQDGTELNEKEMKRLYSNYKEEKGYDYYKAKVENTIRISSTETPDIFADLSFLCAKVRYTILYDATLPYYDENDNYVEGGISSGFGNNSIRFYVNDSEDNTPTASNLRKISFVVPGQTNTSVENDINSMIRGSWKLGLNRYEWPESGVSYPTKPKDELDLFKGTLEEWKGRRQRVWQGVVYLPENNTTGVAHTVLKFPYIMDKYANGEDPYIDGKFKENDFKEITLFGGNNNEQHYLGQVNPETGESYNQDYSSDPKLDQLQGENDFHGLARGCFYDVVARVINPEEWDLKVIVYSRVEDWHDIEQTVTEGSSYEK